MGKDVVNAVFSVQDRVAFRRKLRGCLDALGRMLDTAAFGDSAPMTGLEIEINLVDGDAGPSMRNFQILADLGDPRFQPELGKFNLELNVPPRPIAGDGLDAYESEILDGLRVAAECARKNESRLALIGMLPTLTQSHLVPENLSVGARFTALNRELVASRGDEFRIDIEGAERLRTTSESIAPESACTSVQFHLQVTPETFARSWNASQAIAAIQVALGANSPYLYGRRLWAETRIAFFEQATDSRPDEYKAQGVRPRVWFGERWIDSALDLYEENVQFFPPLLPELHAEDPVRALDTGTVPGLYELRLHNGTVYRWNRPVYDVADGRPHLRVENRVLPSGPTVVDLLANAALYFGLVREMAAAESPVWERLAFADAAANFQIGARHGIEAVIRWPGRGEVPVVDLVLGELLELAHAGLDRFGVEPTTRDRLLGVIEERCRTRRNGSRWQVEAVCAAEQRGLGREAAVREMTQRYVELQRHNEPVHTWR
ncbi:glutamate--cysteine ligase [Actinoplanes sp. NPDC023936]|uniref:glutamate--cysteine ligase n=1 Tax=Actinoplanes sp. NPDC023936 TaxID=3154910 RepID=UPI0033DE32E3